MTPTGFALASGAVALGAYVQGGAGFGAALVAAPLVVLVEPSLVPGPLILAFAVLTYLMAWRERAHLDLKMLGWAAAGRVPGSVIGAMLVASLAHDALDVAFGVIILVLVGISAWGVHVAPTPATEVAVGVLSGVSGTATSVGGPPLALLYQRVDGPTFRATLAALFAVGTVVSLVSLRAVGELSGAGVAAGVALVPAVLVGLWASRHAMRLVDRGYLRPAVLTLSALSGTVVLLRGLL